MKGFCFLCVEPSASLHVRQTLDRRTVVHPCERTSQKFLDACRSLIFFGSSDADTMGNHGGEADSTASPTPCLLQHLCHAFELGELLLCQ
jgi:hypothetical protein